MRGAMQKRKTNRKGGGWMGGDLAGLGPKVRGAKPQRRGEDPVADDQQLFPSKPRQQAIPFQTRRVLQLIRNYIFTFVSVSNCSVQKPTDTVAFKKRCSQK